jgi:hypothetical protein
MHLAPTPRTFVECRVEAGELAVLVVVARKARGGSGEVSTQNTKKKSINSTI